MSKRAIAFFDGQNVYHAAKRCFGYAVPNYDPVALALWATALEPGRTLSEIRFYTGLHSASENPTWHNFWRRKLVALHNAATPKGIATKATTRPLKYSDELRADGTTARLGREKGIDVRLALDLVFLAWQGGYDVALLFSQDTDLAEAIDDVRALAAKLKRPIEIECCFPVAPPGSGVPDHFQRGINRTTWRKIDRATYDAAIDPRDYRRPSAPKSTATGLSPDAERLCAIVVDARARHGLRVWLGPFMRNFLEPAMPALTATQRRRLVGELESAGVLKIVAETGADGQSFSVIEIVDGHPLLLAFVPASSK